jgi:transposase
MLNTNASNNPSVAQQLIGLSFDEIVAFVEQHKQVIAQRDNALSDAKALNEKLTYELSSLRRSKYGQKSESMNVEQVDLFEESRLGDIAAVEAELEAMQASVTVPAYERKSPKGRAPIPAHLPRTDIHHEVESTTCGCGHELKRVGEDITEKLDIVPVTYRVERHIRGKWACAHCQTLVQAPVPAHVIDKGLPTAGLIAHVVVSKLEDHVPLYRYEKISARSGCEIPRSTQAEWIGKTGVALLPLVMALKEDVFKCRVL